MATGLGHILVIIPQYPLIVQSPVSVTLLQSSYLVKQCTLCREIQWTQA